MYFVMLVLMQKTSPYHLCQASKTDGWRTWLDSNPLHQALQNVPSHKTECTPTHTQTYQ